MPVTINGTTGITSPGGDVSTSLTTGSVTTSGTNSVAALTVNSNNISAVNSLGFRNRIINGDMRIDQRNAGGSVIVDGNIGFPVDRFFVQDSTDGAFTAEQVEDAPAGFYQSLKVTVTTADASLGATQYSRLVQYVEGYNVADFGLGAAGASTFTISFWTKSSLTGTFGGAVGNSADNRTYPFTYVISAANTWEQKSVTIVGDTTGTWLKTNGIGLSVVFGLGVGSTYSGTAGAWAATTYLSATGAVSVVGTNGATFYITGVQLEAGTVATPFERRDYGRELMMCQRYLPAWAATAAITEPVASGMADATTSIRISFPFKTSARVKPTGLTVSSNSDFTFYGAGTGAGAVTLGPANTESAVINVATTGATTNSAVVMISAATATAKLLFTGCEL